MDAEIAPQKYYPFGRTRSGSVPTDKLFTGHQQEGSLYFMQARFYPSATLRAGSAPTLGRFLSPDSIVPGYGNPQSLNRYSYVLNNPLRYTDPTGHQEAPIWPPDFHQEFPACLLPSSSCDRHVNLPGPRSATLTDTSPHDGHLADAQWTGTVALSSQPMPTFAWYSQRQQVPSRRGIKSIPSASLTTRERMTAHMD